MHSLMLHLMRTHDDASMNLERIIAILHLLTTCGVRLFPPYNLVGCTSNGHLHWVSVARLDPHVITFRWQLCRHLPMQILFAAEFWSLSRALTSHKRCTWEGQWWSVFRCCVKVGPKWNQAEIPQGMNVLADLRTVKYCLNSYCSSWEYGQLVALLYKSNILILIWISPPSTKCSMDILGSPTPLEFSIRRKTRRKLDDRLIGSSSVPISRKEWKVY